MLHSRSWYRAAAIGMAIAMLLGVGGIGRAGEEARTSPDRHPDPRPERLPRPARGREPDRQLRRSHRLPFRATATRTKTCIPAPDCIPAGGVEYLATHVAQPARDEPEEHRLRLGRRPHRRDAAAVGALPRRADHRGLQPDGPRLQRRRQPRVRRGHHRAASDAVRQRARLPLHARPARWLPSGRRLRRRRPLPRRRLPVPRRQRHLQRTPARRSSRRTPITTSRAASRSPSSA